MDERTFFSYYIPALEKALMEKCVDNFVKNPDWFFPKDMQDELEDYENYIYDKYDLVKRTINYFDSLAHGFPGVFDMSLEDGRIKILEEIEDIKKKFDL